MASYKFQLDWHTFIASKLRYIVVMVGFYSQPYHLCKSDLITYSFGQQVDGRGTGFKGRKYRVGVRGRLGELETIDQVNAGR